jgi:hypothetical protein
MYNIEGKREQEQELNSSETNSDKIGRCRGKIDIPGIGCQKVSFRNVLISMPCMARMDHGQKSQFQHAWNMSKSEMSVSACMS